MKNIQLVLLLLLSSIVYSQKINGEIQNYPKREIVIKNTNGIDFETIGIVNTNNDGQFSYTLPENNNGLIYLEFDTNKNSFFLLADKQDVDFTLDYNNFETLNFKNDPVNSYLQFYNKTQNLPDKIALTQYLFQVYKPSDTFYKHIKEEYLNLNNLSQLKVEKPNNLLLDYYLNYKEKIIKYQNTTTEEEALTNRNEIIQTLINDNQNLEKTGALAQYITTYYQLGNLIYKSKNDIDTKMKKDLDKIVEGLNFETNRGQLAVANLIETLNAYGYAQIAKEYEKFVAKQTCDINPVLKDKIAAVNILSIGNILPDTKIANNKNLYQIPYDKYLIVLFWSPECSHCIEEFPDLESLYPAYKQKGAELIGISLDTNKEKYGIMTDKKQWINIYDQNDKISDFYHVTSTPTFLVLNKKHEILGNLSNAKDVLRYLK